MVGNLRLSEWTDNDGERRSRVQVVADSVRFLDSPKKPGPVDEPESTSPDELAAQLDHADRLISDLMDRVGALESELACCWLAEAMDEPAA